METVVEGRAYYQGKLVQCCIGIENGKIAAIKKILKGDEHHDFGDSMILPAAVDVHVHFRDPGLTRKEDFQSGTISAAFGGVSCVLDMPNTLPPVISPDAVREKLASVSRKAWVDFGLFGGCASSKDPSQIAGTVVAYKIFMSSATGRLLLPGEKEIASALSSIARAGKVVSVHAEEEGMIRKMREESLLDHDRNRPVEAEVAAIELLLRLDAGARVHICHLSSAKSLSALARSQFTKEVTPHHLLLDKGFRRGALGKVNPPLRSKEEREALMDAFIGGSIDILASDHAPHTVDEKEEDFDAAPSGVPGVETMMPLMLNLVRKDVVPLGTLVRAACERPAEVFGLNKGRIEVGKDADLIVVDHKKVERIRGRDLHSKCGWTPFEDSEGVFPLATFVRGTKVVEEGSLVGERIGRDVVAFGSKAAG